MYKERAIFHELLTDFVFSSLLLEKAEKVRALLEKQRFSEALLFLEEYQPYVGQENDEVALLQAVIALYEARYQQALNLIGATLPFVALDRTMSAIAHWVGAVALEGLGRSEDALYWCSLAADQASSPKARPLQIGILCFWAETLAKNGQMEQGVARVQLALRRARRPHELFHVHLTSAHLWSQSDPKKARYHLELAQSLANIPARRLLGDPSGVVCKGGRLWLGKQYEWDSDLRIAVLAGTFDGGQLLPVLACPWLEELNFTLNSPS